MTDQTIALSRRCEESARTAAARGREVTRFGPFEALIDRGTDLIWLNYAVPAEPPGDVASALADLERLKAHFLARGRRPRFEFNAAPWPGLPALLESAGLAFQARQPLMICTPADLRPLGRFDIAVRLLDDGSPDADFMALSRIQGEGFGDAGGEPDVASFASMRAQLRAGASLLALGSLAGALVGAGGIFPDDQGVAELAGVATLPAARRRGVAAALSAALTDAFFSRGGQLAWLSAADDGAESVYARVGYRRLDDRMNYIQEG